MSNSLGIAAVTATLHHLIEKGIEPEGAGIPVTTRPPDKARNGANTPNQINLFLYQTMPNGAWRNMDIPRQVRPGETGHPPLALNLYYLVTAYGENDDDVKGHRLLGRTMSILDDFPVLGSDEINQILLTESGLREQVERVRITPQPLSLDEMSKLWTTFQTQYRLSTAYQVSVVLIESTRPAKTPLPVLTRGKPDPATKRDQGIISQPDLTPPFPTLNAIHLPVDKQPSARLGELLTISGHHLDGINVEIHVKHPRLDAPRPWRPEPGATANKITVKVPNEPENLPAGVYTLAVVVHRTDPDKPGNVLVLTTNELSLAVTPEIQQVPPITVVRHAEDVTITLACKPNVFEGQRAALLLGSREVPEKPPSPANPRNILTFVAETTAQPLPAGDYFVRLRVDGVDSLLINYSAEPLVFDSNQQVTIT